MHWKRLYIDSPVDGTICIVGHFLPNRSKPSIGLWKYCEFGDNSYWRTSNGDKIYCLSTDHWCDVEDIISAVEHRIMEEIKSELS